jgi:NTP pyrophosphatase (non-canonical NTP hydrolase)
MARHSGDEGELSLRQAQAMMRELYYHHDSRRGAEATYDWLVSEVWELGRALKDRGDLVEEFADVLAWLLSLANVCGVDLESALIEKYGWRCPRCGSKPCACEYRERPDARVSLVREPTPP